MHVANLDEARDKLDALLAEVKGYVAKSDESGRSGGTRAGTWKVRVPVGAFHDFLARVQGFGELINKTSDAQDVTEEYVDLEARLKNLKAEEVVLNKLLQEKAQSTADLLAFRKQISDVREQIERLQARLTTLSRLSAMTTIDVVMSEEKPYVPPSAPTFGTSIGRTFGDSINALESLGKGLVLFLVAIAPWSPLIVLGLWLGRRGLRVAMAGGRNPPRPAAPGPGLTGVSSPPRSRRRSSCTSRSPSRTSSRASSRSLSGRSVPPDAPELLDHADAPLALLLRRADRLAGDDHVDRVGVQLREVPQRHPAALRRSGR